VQIQAQVASESETALEAVNDAGRQFEARIAEQSAQKQRLDTEALLALKLPPVTTKKSEVLTKHIGEAAKKDPTLMVHVLRSWLEEDK
jgi:flagellar biosynthesis/type III secretory pathway M-ring protein FliF/YscJ